MVSRVNVWTYIVPGVVTDLSPAQGSAGTLVTILGSGLCHGGGGTSFANVTLAGYPGIVQSSSCGRVVVLLVQRWSQCYAELCDLVSVELL